MCWEVGGSGGGGKEVGGDGWERKWYTLGEVVGGLVGRVMCEC